MERGINKRETKRRRVFVIVSFGSFTGMNVEGCESVRV